nr:extracellular solute-binding protein [Candidatus Sumerlaeota bacterium]
MKKRFPALYILVFLFIILLSSCKTNHRDDGLAQKVTITFWHSMGLQHSKILNGIIADFESQHPQIHVNPVYQGGYTQLLTNLTASCTAGTNPVMSQMYESWTTRFLDYDLLKNVDDLAKDYGGLSPESRSDIPEVFIKDNSWNGKLVTLPFNKSAYMLFYNKDALKKIGFVNEKGEGRPPVTWSEFRDAALKMTQRERTEVRQYGYGVRPFIEGFTYFLFRAGGQYLDSDGKKVLFADEIGRMTLDYLVDMKVKDGSVYVEPGYLDTPFGAGRIAMCVNSTASLPYTEKAVAGRFD